MGGIPLRLRWLAILVWLVPAVVAGCASAPHGSATRETPPESLPRAVAQRTAYQQEELIPPQVTTDDSAKPPAEAEPALIPAPTPRKPDGAMPIDLASALAAQTRTACGPVAPPDGLFLVQVDY